VQYVATTVDRLLKEQQQQGLKRIYVITTYVIGKERLLVAIHKLTGCKIGVTQQKMDTMKCLELPGTACATSCLIVSRSSTSAGKLIMMIKLPSLPLRSEESMRLKKKLHPAPTEYNHSHESQLCMACPACMSSWQFDDICIQGLRVLHRFSLS